MIKTDFIVIHTKKINVMNTKKEYIAPKLTEFSYMSEEGFALSLMNNLLEPNDFDDYGQENWDWNKDGNNQFGGEDWNWDN